LLEFCRYLPVGPPWEGWRTSLSKLPRKENPEFKDYCLIMRVHPAADAAMIDAAYWHLAKRYAAIDDERSRKKLEELNEAYAVMGSADRREEYLVLRASVLGFDALPVPAPPPQEPLPLSVMERQKPRPREQSIDDEEQAVQRRWYAAAISSAFAMPVVLGLAIAAFLAGASPLFMAALLVVGLLAIAGPFAPSFVRLASGVRTPNLALPTLRFPRPRRSKKREPTTITRTASLSLPKLRIPTSRRTPKGEPATITPIDAAQLKSLKSSTESRTLQLRRREAKDAPSPAEEPDRAAVEDPRD
jgi:hypothetical protein